MTRFSSSVITTVGCREQDDALVGLETIHLDQELIERLLALVMTAAEPGAAMTADRVDLVDEDDARRVLLALLEQIPYPAGTDADEHLDEVRTRDGEERHVGLACDSPRQKCLAGSRRTHQQHTLGNFSAQFLELLRLLEKLDDLGEFRLGFFDPGDVLEGDLLADVVDQLGLALAERHSAARCR